MTGSMSRVWCQTKQQDQQQHQHQLRHDERHTWKIFNNSRKLLQLNKQFATDFCEWRQ